MEIKCACGCGETFVPSRATEWRIRKQMTPGFIAGHSTKKERNPRWNGGTSLADGYRRVRAPDGHPNADAHGYIREHRLVMERKIGRPLMEWEIVHHINENKLDNRPENLEIMDRRTHANHHAQGSSLEPKVCPTCGKPFLKKWNHSRDQFCSRACIRGVMPKGSAHHAAKLTPALVREIRSRAERGETQQSIADRIGIQREAVGKVIRRERWAHVS